MHNIPINIHTCMHTYIHVKKETDACQDTDRLTMKCTPSPAFKFAFVRPPHLNFCVHIIKNACNTKCICPSPALSHHPPTTAMQNIYRTGQYKGNRCMPRHRHQDTDRQRNTLRPPHSNLFNLSLPDITSSSPNTCDAKHTYNFMHIVTHSQYAKIMTICQRPPHSPSSPQRGGVGYSILITSSRRFT